jgi:hypothetical protein
MPAQRVCRRRVEMRRIVVLALVVVAVMMTPGAALAVKPVAGCPNPDPDFHPGWWAVNRQVWWERTVEGSIVEGIPVYEDGPYFNGDALPTGTFTEAYEEFAVAYGFASADDLLYFVWVTQWDGIDKNGDGTICMKDRPHTPGNPAYFFNGVDNTAH